MKTKLFAILFIATLCTAGLSSCVEEEVTPKELTNDKKEPGVGGSDDDWD